ncbi:MAG: hypothetical protein JXL97_14530 [Bacteroidales bacterium]|nr:hypothetical protein [Bacteroidales bacterium]
METQTNSESNNVFKFKIRRKELIIDNKSVSFNNKTLLCKNIDKIKYGSTQVYVNGFKANKIFNFFLHDKNGKKMTISFQQMRTKRKVETSKEDVLYMDIIQAFWKHITSKIVNNMLDELKKGKEVQVGKFRLNKHGITIKVWRFFKFKNEEVHIPWAKSLKEVSLGGLVISSKDNKKNKCRQQFLNVWNLNALHSVLDFLWADGKCYLLEKGQL